MTSQALAADIAVPFQVKSARGYDVGIFMVSKDPNQTTAASSPGSVAWTNEAGAGTWYAPQGSSPVVTVHTAKKCSDNATFTSDQQVQFSQVQAGMQVQKIVLPQIQAGQDAAAWQRSVVEDKMNAHEARVVYLINNYRQSRGLPPFQILKRLNYISVRHAMWMNHTGIYTHCGDQGQRIGDRALHAGFMPHIINAENLGTASSPEDMVDSWIKSASHRAAIENPEHVYMGIGYANGVYNMDFAVSPCKGQESDVCALATVPDGSKNLDGDQYGTPDFDPDRQQVETTYVTPYTQRYRCRVPGNVKGYCWRATGRVLFTSVGMEVQSLPVTIHRQNASGSWYQIASMRTDRDGLAVYSRRIYIPIRFRTSTLTATRFVNRSYARMRWKSAQTSTFMSASVTLKCARK